MKTFLKAPVLIACFLIAVQLTSCGGGSHWKGDETTEADKFAKRLCDCASTTISERGVNVDIILSADRDKMREDRKTMSEEEFDKKYADMKVEMEKLKKGGEPKCFDELEEEATKANVGKGLLDSTLKAKCALAKIM